MSAQAVALGRGTVARGSSPVDFPRAAKHRSSLVDFRLTRAATRAHRAWLATERGNASAAVCAATALEALQDGVLLDTAERHSGYHLCVQVLIMADAHDEAARAIAALRERGNASAAVYQAELALRRGSVAEAEQYAVEASLPAVLVCALAERGAYREAHDVLRVHDATAGVSLRHARARLRLAEGRFEDAYADAREVGLRREAQGRPNPTWDGWRSTASLALTHLGRRDEATRLAEAELAAARSFGAPVPIARALHARAVAEPDHHARAELCLDALDEVGEVPARLEGVRLRLELGTALARAGLRVRARDAMRPTLAEADRLGATLLAQRAHRELVATGLRPRRSALEGSAALTPRQRQICELAATGKGNRAIAGELFLSIKTVETHLAAAYRKLGVGTRAGLAASLATA